MYISDEDLLARLSSPENLSNKLTVHKLKVGRSGPDIPEEVRSVIATLANEGEGQDDLSKAFKVTQSSVSNYENGKISGRPSEELKEVVAEVKLKRKGVENQAVDLVLSGMRVLNGQLQQVEAGERHMKPTDVASITASMASVADKIRPAEEREENKPQLHLHLYRPNMKKVEDYEEVEV